MKPAVRFLLGGLVLVAVLTLVAGAGVVWHAQRSVRARTLQRLEMAGKVAAAMQASQLQVLQLHAQLLDGDPAFVGYVAQSLIPAPQTGGAVDSASISDLLNERRRGYDIAAVLDPQGNLVAVSGPLLKPHSSIRSNPLVVRAIHQLAPTQGVWLDHGQLFWVVVDPLLRGGALQGVLIAATKVDNAFVAKVQAIAHCDVALLTPAETGLPSFPSSGLDAKVAQAVTVNAPRILRLSTADAQVMALGNAATPG